MCCGATNNSLNRNSSGQRIAWGRWRAAPPSSRSMAIHCLNPREPSRAFANARAEIFEQLHNKCWDKRWHIRHQKCAGTYSRTLASKPRSIPIIAAMLWYWPKYLRRLVVEFGDAPEGAWLIVNAINERSLTWLIILFVLIQFTTTNSIGSSRRASRWPIHSTSRYWWKSIPIALCGCCEWIVCSVTVEAGARAIFQLTTSGQFITSLAVEIDALVKDSKSWACERDLPVANRRFKGGEQRVPRRPRLASISCRAAAKRASEAAPRQKKASDINQPKRPNW